MKKVLLIFTLFLITFGGCKKYESVMGDDPVPIPYHPDNTWVGDNNFYAKGNSNTLMLLFRNDLNLPGSPFFEYKIGDGGSWSAPIIQATPFDGQSNWGLGTISSSIVIPENALIYIRFGTGTTYANIQTSMFNVGGVICFELPQINH